MHMDEQAGKQVLSPTLLLSHGCHSGI